MEEHKLVIVRHAHRETNRGRERDNGLSTKGKEQAEAVRRYFRFRFGKKAEARLFSSPRARCIETITPLADTLGAEVEVSLDLEEQLPKETNATFAKRVGKFCRQWKSSQEPLMLVCTHGDWIPLVVKELTGAEIRLSKGGWLEIDGTRRPELTWLVQRLE